MSSKKFFFAHELPFRKFGTRKKRKEADENLFPKEREPTVFHLGFHNETGK